MSILSTKTDKIFFTKNSDYNISSKVDLILAPEFYWVRVFDIPIKNSSQAKNVLPTLFEDILDSNIVYTYKAIKLEENKYLCFAYDNKKILDEIKNSNINTNFINSVYFAQTELKEFKNFSLNNQNYMYTTEDILVKLPDSLKQDYEDISNKLDGLTLSSNKIEMKFYNNLISTKQITVLSVILGLFIVINLVNILNYSFKVSELQTKKDEFISSNSLPSSEIQLNSIVNTYSKNINIENKKREIYKFLSDNKNLNIESFSIKDKVIEFKFTNKNLQNKIQKFTKKYKSNITPRTQYIEVRIEL